MKEYIKTIEAAKRLNVSDRTIRRYCANGFIKGAVISGKTWLIPKDFVLNDRDLISVLIDQKKNGIKGGIYNKIQVDFAYNSNHIEGSRLSHDETRLIYETKTIGSKNNRVDDIFETVNHFSCLDYVIDNYSKKLSEKLIKDLHRILKTSTMSSKSDEAVVGDYKKYRNFVGSMETSSPNNVSNDIEKLLNTYNKKEKHSLEEIIEFHGKFEKIHPFYDGNGRVGRLIMFKECLKSNIVPFIIDDKYKYEYYNGLEKYQKGKNKNYLIQTCLLMQDNMKLLLDYFEIKY